MSDILACYRGRFVAIEVKKPGGRVDAAQRNFLRDVQNMGGFSCVVCTAEGAKTLCYCLQNDCLPPGISENLIGVPVFG